MTTNFYAPPAAIRGGRVVLPEDEARHAHTVLRGATGDEMTVVDGTGGWYRVEITHAAPEQVVGTIVEQREEVGEPAVDVTVALGLLKKRSRFETFVEKAVELGVRRIVPLRTARAERESIREERLRNVMVAAMKQCRRSRLPALVAPRSTADLLDESESERQLVCHAGDASVPIRQVVDPGGAAASALVLVGPEGGFAPSEVEGAVRAGATPVSLGARRLRAETAGLAALHAVITAQSN
ncbi:RsmE family RNA methyltransferase [Salinibacter altiplanensis]|uniref:RsmE family RNA methyltransferase n=1 Tax=Salinibacter altiplanensis TaxID=1803181 RepID=UPI000C9F1F06|nr:RsmE family RNA methyltransferase [Salinibacter altiplanensis]